jgi:hypothetical protein
MCGFLGYGAISSSFLSLEPATLIPPCVGRLTVQEWLKERHSEHRVAPPGTRHSKIFIRKPSDTV